MGKFYKTILLLGALFHCFLAYAQGVKAHKFVPFFYTYNAKKLAYKLTHHLKTDEEKVAAIHSWMVSHIKYDVKKVAKNNFERTSIKTILRKRKAVCLGYTDLFNELCKNANIISASVPGYVKGNSDDLNDKLYIDKHIWNAVYIDKQWKLIDVCWDAGYVSSYRLTFIGFFVKILTLGTQGIYKYKPHFVKSPNNFYYLKGGHYFKTDHIASVPMWQLLNDEQNIEYFEKDSAYFLHSYNDSINSISDDVLDAARVDYANAEFEKNMIDVGFMVHKFNHKNHIAIANSYLMMAQDLLLSIDEKEMNKSNTKVACDSVILLTDSSKMHLDSMMYFLNIQKQDLIKNNVQKRDTLRNQNQRLISSTSAVYSKLVTGGKIKRDALKLIKSTVKKSNFKLKDLLKSKRFENARLFLNPLREDSILCVNNIELLNDSLLRIKDSLYFQVKKMDSLFAYYKTASEKYSVKSNRNTGKVYSTQGYRYNMVDDMDLEVRSRKDTLLKYKFNDDLLLFDSKNTFIFKNYYAELKVLKRYVDLFCNIHKKLAYDYTYLKKLGVADADELYGQNLEKFTDQWPAYENELFRLKNNFRAINRYCRRQAKETSVERNELIYERLLEYQMYKIRSTGINKQFGTYYKLNKLMLLKNNTLSRIAIKKRNAKRKD